ncbi:hypothetical protein SASPL_148099 [Salvia splendens]|uniref:MORF/ORRM1/DAG-like MORF domain-containing protein n=1 Tax=Salvia splendens TaxID=180675 RepID=A0A8X8W971_SALSN|nr:hypothetical protein SASPL_148099 [Salvia splendens]
MAFHPLRLRRALALSSSLLGQSSHGYKPQPFSFISAPRLPPSTPPAPPSMRRPFTSSTTLFRRAFNPETDEIGPDTILFEGCDYNHWLITVDFPRDSNTPREQMIETYINIAAQVFGRSIDTPNHLYSWIKSVEEAKKKIYALSTTTYQGFQVECSEETSEKFKSIPQVVFVLPDSYIDPVNKEYGGDKYVNGEIFPRPPPVHYGRRSNRDRRPREQNYGPPQQQNYGPREQNYGPPPQQNFGPPTQQNFGPPPQQNYGLPPRQNVRPPPQQNFGAPPQQNFGAPPQQNFGAPPQQNFGAPPKQNFGAPPQQNFGAPPQQNFGAPPQQNFGAPPQQNFGAPPQQNFGAPPQQNFRAPPQQNYGAPPYQNNASPQQQSYGPPQPSHTLQPHHSYGSPSQQSYMPNRREGYANPPNYAQEQGRHQSYSQPGQRGFTQDADYGSSQDGAFGQVSYDENKPVNLYSDDEEHSLHAVFFVHKLHDMAEEASLVFQFPGLSSLFMALGKKVCLL